MSDSRYSHMPCRVDNYVSEKQMWAVTLMVQPDAAARRRNILVRGEKLLFNHWAAPAHEGVPLPEHLRLGAASVSGNPEGDAGRGIYCRREVVAGEMVLRESPLMEVRNEGGDPLKSQWMLFFMTVREHGPGHPTLQAFLELSDGGIVPTVLPAARRVFGRILDEAAQNPDPEAAAWVARMRCASHREEAEAEATKIAAVLARWQTNGFFFTPASEPAASSPKGYMDLRWEEHERRLAVFRWVTKFQHSCEANCAWDMEERCGGRAIVVRALRPLQAGEQLTLDYLGGKMQTLNVVARREKLAVRGFVCGCSRCLREGGAGDAAAPLPSDEEMLHKPLTEEEVEMLVRSLPASASGEMRTA